MGRFEKGEIDDSITNINEHINEVRDVMVDNIEKVLDRGEKIELLVGKTEQLSEVWKYFYFEVEPSLVLSID